MWGILLIFKRSSPKILEAYHTLAGVLVLWRQCFVFFLFLFNLFNIFASRILCDGKVGPLLEALLRIEFFCNPVDYVTLSLYGEKHLQLFFGSLSHEQLMIWFLGRDVFSFKNDFTFFWTLGFHLLVNSFNWRCISQRLFRVQNFFLFPHISSINDTGKPWQFWH